MAISGKIQVSNDFSWVLGLDCETVPPVILDASEASAGIVKRVESKNNAF